MLAFHMVRFEDLAALPDDRMDVALGAALIAKDVYPGLRVERFLADLHELAAPLIRLGLVDMPPEEQVAHLGRRLFDELGFRGNEADYYDPRNSLLPDVLVRRLGIPISLCVVYCEVARQAGVRASGVSFPGHFLVRVERPAREGGPLIVDAFFGGRVLRWTDLDKLLKRSLGPSASLTRNHLVAASPRAILVRMLTNLKVTYLTRGDFARAHLALDRITTLAPGSAEALRERALLAARLGADEAARADLRSSLELEPDAETSKMARERLAELDARVKDRRHLN